MTTGFDSSRKIFAPLPHQLQAQIKTLSGGRISLAEDAESVSIWRHTLQTKWD